MRFDPPLIEATFLKRYKRFFADVRLADGEQMTVHCPNTGSMKNCLVEETPCWISLSDKPGRKLPGTLEITTTANGDLAGVNTGRPNHLVREAIENGVVTELQGYGAIRREVRYGDRNSRIDLLLENPDSLCYVEVKNVTLESGNGLIIFPDAVTARGTKHLRELIDVAGRGHRAVLFFCVQHSGGDAVAPAAEIDRVYTVTLQEAVEAGVEVLAYGCRISGKEIAVDRKVGFTFTD